MDLPFVDEFSVFQNVVMRMLSRGEAGMISEYADAIAHFEPFYHLAIFRDDLTVLLR